MPLTNEDCIWIGAPFGRDAALLQALLTQAGLVGTVLPAGMPLPLDQGIGALLLTEEALHPALLQALQAGLDPEPAWSDVPIVLLVDPATQLHARAVIKATLGARKSITVLERPVAPKLLVEVMQAVLQMRHRQYQVRTLLHQLEQQNTSLAQEVAERQQIEAALRRSEAKFAQAFNASPLVITITKLADGHLLEVNESFVQITGYTRAEVLGRTPVEVGLWMEPSQRTAGLGQLQAGQTLRNAEFRFRMKDGSERTCLASAELIELDQQPCVLTVLTDITERKRAEAALHALNATLEEQVQQRTEELTQRLRELDEFAYVTSHDLKAPLRAIDHLAHWISEDAGPLLPPASLDHLEKLRGRIRRMEKLLEDLLHYSRANRYPYRAERVDVAQLLEEIGRLVTPPEGFAIHVSTPLPIVVTQRVPLATVLRNLIENAIKHHDHSNGQVQVAVQELDGWLEFSVQDNGPGIAPQFHERIFQLFQTLKPRDTLEGSGMGLAIVKKLIESRGGRITLESQMGQGATFRFTWPKG